MEQGNMTPERLGELSDDDLAAVVGGVYTGGSRPLPQACPACGAREVMHVSALKGAVDRWYCRKCGAYGAL